jgi:hypothetical protein
MKKMVDLELRPNTVGNVVLAWELFGKDQVSTDYPGPLDVKDVPEEDLETVTELLVERGIKVNVKRRYERNY